MFERIKRWLMEPMEPEPKPKKKEVIASTKKETTKKPARKAKK